MLDRHQSAALELYLCAIDHLKSRPDAHSEIRRLRSSGHTLEHIGRLVGMTYGGVRYHIHVNRKASRDYRHRQRMNFIMRRLN